MSYNNCGVNMLQISVFIYGEKTNEERIIIIENEHLSISIDPCQ